MISNKEIDELVNFYISQRSQNKIKLYIEYFKDFKQKLKNFIASKIFSFQRTNKFTKKRYDFIYEHRIIKNTHLADFNDKIYEYNNKKFFASEGLIKKIYLQTIIKSIEYTGAKNILDVGCGNGINIKIISTVYNDTKFHGIDQSTTGIKKANELKDMTLDEDYTQGMKNNFNFQRINKNISFSEQDAQYLNFSDNSFDFVYTVLALEQMQNIQTKVINELKRVSQKYILLIEPFKNLNTSGIRYLHHQSKKYFDLNPEEIECNHWKIEKYGSNFPNYISLKVGFLLLKKI
mgnify:FL=1|jgi:ubiquinone/menaquinone biosynthesis C-methylase UbiE